MQAAGERLMQDDNTEWLKFETKDGHLTFKPDGYVW